MIFTIKNNDSAEFASNNEVFTGFHRTVIDPALCPKHSRGVTREGRRWSLGRLVSDNSRILHLECKLVPQQSVAFDTDQDFIANLWQDAPLPKDILTFFGVPTANGVTLPLMSFEPDNGCWVATFKGRFAWMLVGELILRYYPGQQWAAGTWSVYCSNPNIPDLTADFSNVKLTMGQHQVQFGVSRFGEKGYIGDGQVRRTPAAVAFGDWGSQSIPYYSADMASRLVIKGHGLRKVGICGLYDQARFDPALWTKVMTDRMWTNLEGYDLPPIGPAKNTTSTGDEEEQGCEQGKESLYPGGLGGEVPRILSGLGHGRQPCHYLNADGSMMLPEQRPQVLMWQGRPLWESLDANGNQIASPSWLLLGKPRAIDINGDVQGWFGPDNEHVLIHDTAAGYELSGDEALLEELRHSARNYLWEETSDPKKSTSDPWATRARGWRGMQVAHLLHLLPKSDPLRLQVAERWTERVAIYQASVDRNGIWDGAVFPKNFELRGYDSRVFVYQIAVGAFGIWQVGKLLNHEPSKKLAADMASFVVSYGYQSIPPTPLEWEMIGKNDDGTFANWMEMQPGGLVEGVSGHRTGWFRTAWMPLSLTVVMESGVGEVSKARDYFDYLLNVYRSGFNSHDLLGNFPADWFAPPQLGGTVVSAPAPTAPTG